MKVDWPLIRGVMEEHWSAQLVAAGRWHHTWRVPSPAGGSFQVEVRLGRRWAAISVDRFGTTNLVEEPAEAWFREHAYHRVQRGQNRRVLPSACGSFAMAYPVALDDLLPLLIGWVDMELTWGLPPEDASEDTGEVAA